MKIVLGVAELVAGAALIAIDVMSGGILTPVLIPAAISLIAGGIGTLLTKSPTSGLATSISSPIAAWQIVYGTTRCPGVQVFVEETGDTNK